MVALESRAGEALKHLENVTAVFRPASELETSAHFVERKTSSHGFMLIFQDPQRAGDFCGFDLGEDRMELIDGQGLVGCKEKGFRG